MSHWLLFIFLLSVIVRWHSVCHSWIASSRTHGLRHDHLGSQFPKSNPWCKQWLGIKKHYKPYLPKADYQAWPAEKSQFVGLFWLRCETLQINNTCLCLYRLLLASQRANLNAGFIFELPRTEWSKSKLL